MNTLGHFGASDWAVVAGVLAFTTVVGWVVGRRSSIREYFLAGRTLPWWAVSGSIVATEISALTLVSVPAIVFAPGGNFTYLQIAIFGNIAARCLVAWLLVPAWYEREIYSPYEYVEARLGKRARQMTSALFALGGVLAQGARLYLTALVLEILLHDELAGLAARTHVSSLAFSIGIIGAFAVFWTWIGGVASVVWTDLVLLVVFTAAAACALFFAIHALDTGFDRFLQVGVDAHKFRFFDFDTSPARAYTFWAAVLAASWGGVGAYGMDQTMAQRVFCCGTVREARKALVWSSASVLVTVLVAFVGVALFAWYERHPLTGDALALWRANPDRILPLFVVEHVPSPWKGLIAAGIFAAAISTLAGVFTALSQTALVNLYDPWRPATDERGEKKRVRAARAFVLVSGLVLCASALAMKRAQGNFASVLDLGLALSGFTQGALLAAFFLAWLARRPDGSGFLWSAPLSVAWVFGLAWHGELPALAIRVFALGFFALWLVRRVRPAWRERAERGAVLGQTAALAAGLAGLVWANAHALFLVPTSTHAAPEYALQPLQFPWYVPVGSVVAFVYGHWLARSGSTAGDFVPARADHRAA